MATELPKNNLKHEELNTTLSMIFDKPAFLSGENQELDQKTDDLVLVLKHAFEQNPEYSDFFEMIENSRGPSLNRGPSLKAIRAAIAARNGITTTIDSHAESTKVLPNRKKLMDSWSTITHLSHGEDIDEVFDKNTQIEQMINEICSLVGVTQESVEKTRQERKAVAEKPFDLNALAALAHGKNSKDK